MEELLHLDHVTLRGQGSLSTASVANISRVTAQLWIGGDLESRDPALATAQITEIRRLGIGGIVDCRIEWNDEDFVAGTAPEIEYLWLGINDAGQRIPDKWFDEGTSHISDLIGRGETVLAHCHMGINRGPTMGLAAMLVLGWDPIDALDRIRRRRPIAYVGYAEDAVDWWCRTNGATRSHRAQQQERLREWRGTHNLDVAGVIRKIRQASA